MNIMFGPQAPDGGRCFCPQACLRAMILPSGYDLALGLTPSGQIVALRQNPSPQTSPQAKASPSLWALGPSMIFISPISIAEVQYPIYIVISTLV